MPVILAPLAAELLNLLFPGWGIPAVLLVLSAVVLWIGIASWRRNARLGLHRRTPTTAAAHDGPGVAG